MGDLFHILPKLGDLRVDQLGPATLRQWVRGLKGSRAPATTRNICNTLVELDVTTSEVVARPLALAVGNDLGVDDGPPDDYPAAVRETDDPAISGLLPAEVPAARGCPTGSNHESRINSATWRGSQAVRQRFAKPLYAGSNPVLASRFRRYKAHEARRRLTSPGPCVSTDLETETGVEVRRLIDAH